MCGIAGYSLAHGEVASIDRAGLNRALGLAIEHRGRDATGVAFIRDAAANLHVVKRPGSATKFFKEMPDVGKGAVAALIHTRNATNGHPSNEKNNHPHKWGTTHLIHNGIISNYDPVFEALDHKPYSACDSEAAAVAVAEKGPQYGMEMLAGWASVAWIDETDTNVMWGANLDGEHFLLVTAAGSIVFGSEKATVLDPDVILAGVNGFDDDAKLYDVQSGTGWRFDRSTAELTWWSFDDNAGRKNYPNTKPKYASYGNLGGYGTGWDEEDDAAWARRMRAVTSGEAQSEFAEGPPSEASRLPFDDSLDEIVGSSDAVIGADEDDEPLVVHVGDHISIGDFAAEVLTVESEHEITVRWLDDWVDLDEVFITLLERAPEKEEELA